MCVSAHIHALTAYKQQYRFNYRRPSSCLSLCFSVCVFVCWLYGFLCKCVCVCVAVEMGGLCQWVSFHCSATFMSNDRKVWLLRKQHLYCCVLCLFKSVCISVCVPVCVDSSTCKDLKPKCAFFNHVWTANPKYPLQMSIHSAFSESSYSSNFLQVSSASGV